MTPTVNAVMLTADRPELARRAIECFKAQTYANALLVIYDTGEKQLAADAIRAGWFQEYVESGMVGYAPMGHMRGKTIGELRNAANALCQADILVHWDDDDWSHPRRIEEQVELLQSSGLAAVGYREMLFWRTADAEHAHGEEPDTWTGDQAWLYSNGDPRYCLGTSLCYWRKTWEALPFESVSNGEDERWLMGLRQKGLMMKGTTAQGHRDGYLHGPASAHYFDREPRMIATIHGGNTVSQICAGDEWRRAQEWDQRVGELLS